MMASKTFLLRMSLVFNNIYAMFLLRTVNGFSCPKHCYCKLEESFVGLECDELPKLPSMIPKNAFEFKIERKTVDVPERYFSNMTLSALKLENVGLSHAIILPIGVESVFLNGNHLTIPIVNQLLISGFPNLLLLAISDNKLHIAQRNQPVFTNVSTLHDLNLAHNHIPVIDNVMFANLKAITKLNLRNCSIMLILPHAFKVMTELVQIDLSFNNLKSLPAYLFVHSYLNDIMLQSNYLHRIPMLNTSKFYLSIDMSNNLIHDLDCTPLHGVRVVSISFRNNSIRSLLSGVLDPISVLFSIDLSHNRIITISPDVFKESNHIKVINLSNNELFSISSTLFAGISMLYAVYINGNKLYTIPDNLFRGLNVDYILLHGNSLTVLNRPFRGIGKSHTDITLFDSNMTDISHTLLGDLGPQATLYLGCDRISALSTSNKTQCNIVCSSTDPFSLDKIDSSLAKSLTVDGFECFFADKLSTAKCTSCRRGFYNNGHEKCMPCPRGGYFQDQPAQSKCKRCNPGQFVNHTSGIASLDCKTCPKGTNPNMAADTRACYCLHGFARRDRFSGCFNCTEFGMSCIGDIEELSQGFWWSWPNVTEFDHYLCFRKNIATTGIQYDEKCNTFLGQLPTPYRCPLKEACLGGHHAKCHANYTGPLCSVCNQDYYLTYIGCLRCPGKALSITKLLFLPCLIILVGISVIYADRVQLQGFSNRTLADVIFSVSKITLGYYQMLAVMILLLSEIAWPKFLINLSKTFYQYTVLVFNFPSLKCIHPDLDLKAYNQMLLSIVSLLVVPIIFISTLYAHCWFRQKVTTTPISTSVSELKKFYIRYVILIWYICYPMVCQKIFQVLPFACHKVCFDRDKKYCKEYLRADYREECPASYPPNSIYIKIGYAALIFPIGFPLLLLLLLYYCKRRDFLGENSATEDNVIAFAVKFCYENYERSCWYWEVIEMLRKLLFTVGFAFFGLNTRISLAVLILLAGIFTIAYASWKPIRYRSEHILQMIAMTSLMLNLCTGVVLKLQSDQIKTVRDSSKDRVGINIILIIANAALLGAMLLRFIQLIVVTIYHRFCRHM